jgi:predicted RND superfamily exporter protein
VSALLRFALARRRTVLAVSLAAAAALGPGALRLETDNSPPVWFVEDAPEVDAYRRLVARFGSDEGYRLAFEGPALGSPAGLAFLERLEADLAALPGVRATSSALTHHRPEMAAPAAEDPAGFRRRIEGNALDRAAGWVGADGAALSLLIETDALPPRAAAALERDLAARAAAAPAGLAATLVGTRSLEHALDASSREIGTVFFPLLIGLALALLAATFRDWAGIAAPLACVAWIELVVLGALGWASVRMNLVLAVLPPLLFAIALASALHVQIPVRAREAAGEAPATALAAVYRDKSRALAWTLATTAAGFTSLAISPVPPVAALGLAATFALAVVGVGIFLFQPALLATLRGRGALPERALEAALERAGGRLAAGAARRRRTALAAGALLAVGAVAGLPRLERESDAFAYLAPDHPTRRAAERLERLGMGFATLELLVEAPPGEPGLREAAAMTAAAGLGRRLRELPGVLGALGAGELVEDVAAASPFAALAGSAEELVPGALDLLGESPEGRRALDRFVSADGRAARLTVFVRHGGYEAIEAIAVAAEAEGRRAFPGARVEASGQLRVLLGLHRSLLATLGGSLALMAVVLLVTFAALLRRAGPALAALVPTAWPVALVLGGMAWAGVPLDVATVMVASIVCGLGVDASIHVLARRREGGREAGTRAAVAEGAARAAPVLLVTGAILCSGFGVCALSGFAPIARFGALSAVAIALSVVAALVLLPALFARGRA